MKKQSFQDQFKIMEGLILYSEYLSEAGFI